MPGGLDSGLIAAFARRYFDRVTFYTYGFVQEGGLLMDDAESGIINGIGGVVWSLLRHAV
jgi:asparagine synthetase B (glutamine-hydrolysing)